MKTLMLFAAAVALITSQVAQIMIVNESLQALNRRVSALETATGDPIKTAGTFGGGVVVTNDGVEPPRKCEWSNHPDWLYKLHNWYCIDSGGEILATVRRHDDGDPFDSFIGGAACGSGQFTKIDAAKACVEKTLWGGSRGK